MELELEKRKKERYECIFDGRKIYEESCEIIVPDQSPDIARIIKGNAKAFLKDKNAREGKVDISGNIKGTVLYVAEGEKYIRKLNVSVPFAYVADCPGTAAESVITASVCVKTVDVREINPRKVSVKIGLEVHISVYKYGELSVCGGVKDATEYGIYTKTSEVSVYRPLRIANKAFVISDDIELNTSESDMGEILTSDVTLAVTDTKVIGNKAIIKGNAGITYVYTIGEEAVETGEYELPFSQITDVEGMNTEDSLKINLAVTGFELEPQYDASGKARYMTVSITSEASVYVFSHDCMELVDDAYSVKYPLELKKEKITEMKFCEKYVKRVAVSETLETGIGVKRVLDFSVCPMSPVRRRDEGGEVFASDATVTVVYVAEDDSIYSASRRVAIVCPMALKESRRYETTVSIGTKTFSLGGNNEINIRFFADFDIEETEETDLVSISGMSVDAEQPINVKERPGVVVKRIIEPCDIWTLAKEHLTTVEEIKAANGISDETELRRGKMILIPQKR